MKEIVLIVFLILSNGQLGPPVFIKPTSVEQCWSLAEEFIKQDPKKYKEDAIGLGAGCFQATSPNPEQKESNL